MRTADHGLAEMSEQQRESLMAVARLMRGENVERVAMILFQMGFLEGMSAMARSQAARVKDYAARDAALVDSAMRRML